MDFNLTSLPFPCFDSSDIRPHDGVPSSLWNVIYKFTSFIFLKNSPKAAEYLWVKDVGKVIGGSFFFILENMTLGDLDLITYALDTSVKDFDTQKDKAKWRKYLKGLTGQTNVPIAAAVTAYSRMIINGFFI
jgi:hypothetical protein